MFVRRKYKPFFLPHSRAMELPEDVPIMTHAIGKMAMYDMFLKEEELQFLIVVGESGTGKTAALQLVCDGVSSHPQIDIIYDGKEPTVIPAKNSDAPIKYITHTHTLGDKEAFLAQNANAWVFEFQGKFPPPKKTQ